VISWEYEVCIHLDQRDLLLFALRLTPKFLETVRLLTEVAIYNIPSYNFLKVRKFF
jgi:hypothetical protein